MRMTLPPTDLEGQSEPLREGEYYLLPDKEFLPYFLQKHDIAGNMARVVELPTEGQTVIMESYVNVEEGRQQRLQFVVTLEVLSRLKKLVLPS